jgi:hypothetical protein
MLHLMARFLTGARADRRARQQTTAGPNRRAEAGMAGDGTDRGAQPGADERAEARALRRAHPGRMLRRRPRLLGPPLAAGEVVSLKLFE